MSAYDQTRPPVGVHDISSAVGCFRCLLYGFTAKPDPAKARRGYVLHALKGDDLAHHLAVRKGIEALIDVVERDLGTNQRVHWQLPMLK